MGQAQLGEQEPISEAEQSAEPRQTRIDEVGVEPQPTEAMPIIMVDKARTEPTDRSMPAVKIARNMPIETMALTAACEATFIKLSICEEARRQHAHDRAEQDKAEQHAQLYSFSVIAALFRGVLSSVSLVESASFAISMFLAVVWRYWAAVRHRAGSRRRLFEMPEAAYMIFSWVASSWLNFSR